MLSRRGRDVLGGIPVLNLGLWKTGMLSVKVRAVISSTAWRVSVGS